MKYKMFVSDLDGTLLDNNHKISEDNIAAIKKLEAKGIKFVIATGRTKFILEDFLKIVDYKMPLIWSNGSAVSGLEDETLYTEEIDLEVARKIISLSKEYGVDYMVHTLDGIVGEKTEGSIERLKNYNTKVKVNHRIPLKVDKDLCDNLDQHNILKISLSSDEGQLGKLQEAIQENIKEVHAVFSDPTLLDINAPKASKGEAVLRVAAMYGIKPDEVVAIGDNENDISMLKVVGLPLTLENAKDSIKEFAEHITKDSNSSGVADAIERFVL